MTKLPTSVLLGHTSPDVTRKFNISPEAEGRPGRPGCLHPRVARGRGAPTPVVVTTGSLFVIARVSSTSVEALSRRALRRAINS